MAGLEPAIQLPLRVTKLDGRPLFKLKTSPPMVSEDIWGIGVLKSHLIPPLQLQDRAGFVRRGDRAAQAFDDLARQLDLFSVGLRQPSLAGPERILKPHP